MANRYWVGGGSSNTWDALGPTNWSDVSGGTNNFSVPGPGDDVFFTSAANTTNVLSNPITIDNLTYESGYTATTTLNALLRVTNTLSTGNHTSALTFGGTFGFDVNNFLEPLYKDVRFSTLTTAVYRVRDSFIGIKCSASTTNAAWYYPITIPTNPTVNGQVKVANYATNVVITATPPWFTIPTLPTPGTEQIGTIVAVVPPSTTTPLFTSTFTMDINNLSNQSGYAVLTIDGSQAVVVPYTEMASQTLTFALPVRTPPLSINLTSRVTINFQNNIKFTLDYGAYCDTVMNFYNFDARGGRTINQTNRQEPFYCLNIIRFYYPLTISYSSVI